MFNTLIITLTPKKSCIICKTDKLRAKNRDDDTCAPGININRVAQNKNLTYFAFGFSVISLTISELLLEIHLESMQQTELRQKCFIITGGRSKVSPIVSPKKQLWSCHATRANSKLNFWSRYHGWQNEIIRLQKSENSSLPWNLRNSIISPLWEMGMFNFLVKYAVRMFFPGVRNLHKHSIFFLRPIGPFVPYSMRPKGKRVRPKTQWRTLDTSL